MSFLSFKSKPLKIQIQKLEPCFLNLIFYKKNINKKISIQSLFVTSYFTWKTNSFGNIE